MSPIIRMFVRCCWARSQELGIFLASVAMLIVLVLFGFGDGEVE